jgi:flagellar biosynthesis/type III secretory pathway protein FliH
MTDSKDAAEKIMDLIDEFPSQPLTFERKQVMDQLECLVAQHTQQIDDELNESFALGLDEGRRQGEEEAKDELHSDIEYLKEKIDELEEEVRKSYDDGFAAGLEVGAGQQH